MANARFEYRPWVWAGGLALLLLLMQIGGEAVQWALRLDAAALSRGQWWRFPTAHLVHLGWTHAALNAAGVMVCCALSPALFDDRLPWRVGALAVGISLCLWGFSPGMLPYVGFSGVLYGLFVLGLAPQAWRRDPYATTALGLITIWMLWQWGAGPIGAEERLIGGPIASVAHVYGYGLAALYLLAKAGLKRWLATLL